MACGLHLEPRVRVWGRTPAGGFRSILPPCLMFSPWSTDQISFGCDAVADRTACEILHDFDG
jgi:hypothetical protein